MKKILLICLLLFIGTCPLVHAEEKVPENIDEKTKEVANQLILNVYYDILDIKDRYKELAAFGENALYENKHGIYTIIYQYEGDPDARQKTPYAFGITIDRMEDTTFTPQRGSFNYGFPAIAMKISGYQQKHLLRSQYNIMPIVEKYGYLLSDHQQNYLPLRLYLRTIKETYKVKEDIEFELILKNVSKRHMIVKALGQSTLFFLFNNQFWGTKPNLGVSGGQQIVLKAGESLNMRFKGESFQRPREFEIQCTYRMSINGVNPTGVLKIKVVEDEPAEAPPQL